MCSVVAPLHSLEVPAGGTVQSPLRPLSHLCYTEPPASPLLPALYRASHVPSPTCAAQSPPCPLFCLRAPQALTFTLWPEPLGAVGPRHCR